jgi:glycosyltransferase involved in cell wall biosynthesis
VRIGIVTPACNAEAWLPGAIHSVLGQSHRDWRMAVVDDGSTDRTADVAARFHDPRLQLIKQSRAGVSAARNRGITALDADAFLFLDADDILLPGALASLAAALEDTPWAVAVGGCCVIAAVSAPGAAPCLEVPGPRPPRGDLLETLLVRNCFVNGGHLLIRQEAIRRAGYFCNNLSYGEDWEYWIRVALQGEFEAVWDSEAVLLVRRRIDGAYLHQAHDSASFDACMAAIYSNPALTARFGLARVTRLRQRAEAENAWIIGRELVRRGEISDGTRWMRRSVAAAPTPRRIALLAAAIACGALPEQWRGRLRPYALSAHAEATPAEH